MRIATLILKSMILILFIQNSFILAQPIVYIPEYIGLFGNQIYQFCAAKILSEELGMPLQCAPIFGFPETYLYENNIFNKNLSYEAINRKNFLQTIRLNLQTKNLMVKDCIFPYSNFIKHKNQIKKWLRFESPLEFQKNPNDIVLHVRIYTTPGKLSKKLLPFSFYDEILSSAKYDHIYICTNEPNHPYIQNFKKYNPIIKSTTSLHEILYEKQTSYEDIIKMNFEEFRFIASFNKIVIALSTFSWWAAFLSEATEVFVPNPINFNYEQNYPNENRYKLINITL